MENTFKRFNVPIVLLRSMTSLVKVRVRNVIEVNGMLNFFCVRNALIKRYLNSESSVGINVR